MADTVFIEAAEQVDLDSLDTGPVRRLVNTLKEWVNDHLTDPKVININAQHNSFSDGTILFDLLNNLENSAGTSNAYFYVEVCTSPRDELHNCEDVVSHFQDIGVAPLFPHHSWSGHDIHRGEVVPILMLLVALARHYDYGENLPQSVTYEVYADGRKVQRNLTGTKKHNTIFRPTLELVIEDGNHADRVIAVHSHKSVLLGRSDKKMNKEKVAHAALGDSECVLVSDEGISGLHAKIFFNDNLSSPDFCIEDYGSTNGTSVVINSQLVPCVPREPRPLNGVESISIAGTVNIAVTVYNPREVDEEADVTLAIQSYSAISLMVVGGPDVGVEYPLGVGGEVTLGRKTASDDTSVKFGINDPERNLSRNHCRVALSSNELVVEELSKNGVWTYAGPHTVADAGVDYLELPWVRVVEPVVVRPPSLIRMGRNCIVALLKPRPVKAELSCTVDDQEITLSWMTGPGRMMYQAEASLDGSAWKSIGGAAYDGGTTGVLQEVHIPIVVRDEVKWHALVNLGVDLTNLLAQPLFFRVTIIDGGIRSDPSNVVETPLS